MIKLGSGGTAGLGYFDGLKKIKELNLSALECEFTHGVNMPNLKAVEIGKLAKRLNISLSVHAPYYINLVSEEKAKIKASKSRILQSCERAHHLNAKYVVFHAAYYGKREKQEVYDLVKKEIIEMNSIIKKNKWNVALAPETTGKQSQFGDLDELLKLKKEAGCSLCVDFAHLKARNNGVIDYDNVFDKLKDIKHIHSHFSGIEWTEKGERRHLLTKESDLLPLLKQIIKRKKDITIINESPDPIGDSVKTKRLIDRLMKKSKTQNKKNYLSR